MNPCRSGIQAFGGQLIKIYKHHIPPNDLKFDHWRTPLDRNIEWKSQDFHNAIDKIETYKYARRIPNEKSKRIQYKVNTSLKSSPIISSKEINVESNIDAKKVNKRKIDKSLSSVGLIDNIEVINQTI